MNQFREKREFIRLKTKNLKVEYSRQGDRIKDRVEVIDICYGGLCFLNKSILSEGEKLSIVFPFESEQIELNAEVRRIDGREVGVKFLEAEWNLDNFLNIFNEEYPMMEKKTPGFIAKYQISKEKNYKNAFNNIKSILESDIL